MMELNYMILEDALNESRIAAVRTVFIRNLQVYIKADKQLQRVTEIDGYGSSWQKYLLESPEEYQDRLNKAIDAAFSSLTILHKEYKKLTNARLFDGGIGRPKKECSEEEWDSFRPEKAEVLDEVITYLMLRTQDARRQA